jgi:hypothetical protein
MIYLTSMLNTELIAGATDAYGCFRKLLSRRLGNRSQLVKLARQTVIRRSMFSIHDTKNGYGGMRDLQTVLWLYQIENRIINNFRLEVGHSLFNRLLRKVMLAFIKHYKRAKKGGFFGILARGAIALERVFIAVAVTLKIRRWVL